MSLMTANGVGLLDGSTISMPLVGAWIGDLILDQPDGTGFEAGKKVTIQAANGITLNGVVDPARTGSVFDAIHVRVIGGAGGLENIVTPRGYAQPSALVRDVLNGLAADSGETLSNDISASVLTTNLVAWNTMALPMSHALVTLINHSLPGANWRILGNGSLWVGQETWPTVSPEYILIINDPKEGTFDLGVDSPSIVPGTQISGIGKITKLEHRLEPGSIRTKVWVTLASEEDRGLRASIGKIVRQEMNGIDYFTLYDAKVAYQSPDLTTVDLTPGDTRLPGLQRVPIRWGVPGYKAQIAPGCTMRLGWDRGDPSRPYAALWNGGETVLTETLAAQAILLGGDSAIDALIKGTFYRTQQSIFDTALSTFVAAVQTFVAEIANDPVFGAVPTNSAVVGAAQTLATLPTPVTSPLGTMITAIATFEGLAAQYLSTVSKTV
jgi:hypothetical protein